MQYVLNYRVTLGDSSEHMLKMLSSCIQVQLYSLHHILRRFPKCLTVNVSDLIHNCLTEFSKCPRSILVYSVLKVAPQEEIWRCEVRWFWRPQIFWDNIITKSRRARIKLELPRQRTNAGTGWVHYLTRQGSWGIRLANILTFQLDKERKHARPTFNCQYRQQQPYGNNGWQGYQYEYLYRFSQGHWNRKTQFQFYITSLREIISFKCVYFYIDRSVY